MKKLQLALLLLFAIFALCVIIVFTAPTFVNWQNNKGIVENLVGEYLGYRVKINGDLQVQLMPNPKIYAEDIVVDSVSSNTKLAEVGHVILSKKLSDLLMFNLSIDEMVVNRPKINLITDEEGRNNWEPLKVKNSGYYSRKLKNTLAGLTKFGQIVIENGTVGYVDEKEDTSKEITKIYGTITRDSKTVLTTKLKGIYNGDEQKVNINVDIENPDSLRVKTQLFSQDHDINLQGLLNNPYKLSKVQFVGKLSAKFADANNLKFNHTVFKLKEKYLDLKALELTSEINVSKNRLDMSMIDLKSKYNQLKGNFNISKDREGVTSSIKLDIDKIYIKKDDANHAGGKLEWSDELLDFSYVNDLRINTSIVCLECTYGNRTFYQINLKANLENNNLIVSQLNLKTDKDGFIKLTANAGLNSPVGFEVKAEAQGFPVHTLLPTYITKTAEFNLDGAFNLSGTGVSLKALLGKLSGSLNLDFKDIVLRKVDDSGVAVFAKSLLQGKGKTNFDTTINEMKVVGSIRDGVLRTSDIDFNLSGDSITAKGKVDLANLTLNYRVEPDQLRRNNLGVVISGNINQLDIIQDKITPKGVIDGFNRLVTTNIVKKAKKKEIKTYFDYNDKSNLEQNVQDFLFQK